MCRHVVPGVLAGFEKVDGVIMSGNVVAIDGPSASGKSTVARRVAQALGWLYVDSGALYRGVTWLALRDGLDTGDGEAMARLVQEIDISFFVSEGAVCSRIHGVQRGDELRTESINAHVSPVAVVPEVREYVVRWLRDMRSLGDLVVEGRDIGTVVFPDSPFKFYLDASPEERARRRPLEMTGGEDTTDVARVGDSLKRRDQIDSSRKTAPLRVADGASVIDSTAMGIEDVAAFVLDKVRQAFPLQ